MDPLIHVFLNLCAVFFICLADQNMRMKPRIIHPNPSKYYARLPKEEKNAAFYLIPHKTLYIGGEDVLYSLTHDLKSEKNFTITAESKDCIEQLYCNNYVTFVSQLLGDLTVCGTNGSNPGCWRMDDEKFQKIGMTWTEQLAPRTPGTNYNILITGNQIYSTLPRKSNNAATMRKAIFRKINGTYPLLYTGDTLMRNPYFVKSLVVEKENRVQDKILLFFIEDNSVTRTTENRVSMVAQMCKWESGSAKPSTRNVFSTALKTRLMCGNEITGQYFPYLQDIYFLQGKSENIIYGLFTNAWNHSAVCSYNTEDIEFVFNTSSLFGASNKALKIRPGTCLPSSEFTPEATSDEASDFPELAKWLWPSGNQEVFQTLTHYTKIVVDEITAADQESYRVLILATDNGIVHKVVQHSDGALNILELHPFREGGWIRYLELEPKEHVVYVGTTHEISKLPLDDCTAYNTSCAHCIQSRDPYCGWHKGECQSILKPERSSIFQNMTQGAVCNYDQEAPTQYVKTDAFAPRTNEVPQTMMYLSCPAVSKHATYSWKNGDKDMGSCIIYNDTCYLLFKEITYPGKYQCLSQEMEVKNVVLEYDLMSPSSATRIQYNWFVGLALLLVYY